MDRITQLIEESVARRARLEALDTVMGLLNRAIQEDRSLREFAASVVTLCRQEVTQSTVENTLASVENGIDA